MNDIDDLKAVVDQLLIQQTYLLVKLDAVASLLHSSVLKSGAESARRELLSHHFERLHQALDKSIDSLISNDLLFSSQHACKLKFQAFDEIQDLRRIYGLDH